MFVALAVGLGGGAGLAIRDLSARPPSSAPTSTTTTPTTVADQEPTGDTTVQLAADVSSDPHRDAVLDLLQRHFDAINSKDYEAWIDTVTAPRAQGMPQERWTHDYGSTTDTDMVVHRIEPTTSGFVLLLSFISRQEADLAPADLPVECIRWWVSYPVIEEADELRLGGTSRDTSQREAC